MSVGPKAKNMWAAVLVSLLIHAVALSFFGWNWTMKRHVARVPIPSLGARLKIYSPQQDGAGTAVYGNDFFPSFAQGNVLGIGAIASPAGVSDWAGVAPAQADVHGKHAPVMAARSRQASSEIEQPSPSPAERFLSPLSVDRIALAVSAPDMSMLKPDDLPSGILHWRLFIDEVGEVVDIQPTGIEAQQTEGYESLDAMFKATRFIPAIKNRKEVASYLDIEIDVAALTQSSAPAAQNPGN